MKLGVMMVSKTVDLFDFDGEPMGSMSIPLGSIITVLNEEPDEDGKISVNVKSFPFKFPESDVLIINKDR